MTKDIEDLVSVPQDLPAFLLYAQDFLADPKVAPLTTEQVGAYFLLLLYHWIDGYLPDDDRALAAMTRTGRKWSKNGKLAMGILPLFRKIEHPKLGRILVNKRLVEERAKALKKRHLKHIAACKRWGKQPDASAYASDMHGICIASSISITPPIPSPSDTAGAVAEMMERLNREIDPEGIGLIKRVFEFVTMNLKTKKQMPDKKMLDIVSKIESRPVMQIARACHSFENADCYERRLRWNYLWAIIEKSASSWMTEYNAEKRKKEYTLG